MQMAHTATGLVVPTSALAKDVTDRSGRMMDAFRNYEFVREYAPGGPKHFGDPRVATVNKELAGISERYGQPVFAAWHEPHQAVAGSKLFGVVIWCLSHVSGEGQILGHPCPERLDNGMKKGTPNVDALKQWLATIQFAEGTLAQATKRYLEYIKSSEREASADAEAKLDRQAGYMGEAIKALATINGPSRSDRTVTPGGGKSKERRRREILNTLDEKMKG
jgi:hypothetical protein